MATALKRAFPATPVIFLLVAALGCSDDGRGPAQREQPAEPDPDARFLTDAPCPGASAGIALEETTGFVAGDAPSPLVVLMGGSTEVDDAAIRFAEAARGGDVLVLRATGSTSSYTTWFADELALDPAPRAVATVRIDDAAAGGDPSVLCRVARADAVWLAGGDQSHYLLRWPAELHASLARAVARGVAIGGTSAGAMSLSDIAFDAEHDTIDSEAALTAPLADAVSLSRSPFAPDATAGVLADTHFSQRERLGRLIAFVARAAHDEPDREPLMGLGIDEETAVVIDQDAVAVSGAGDAWLVTVSLDTSLAEDTPLSSEAVVAPLSLQSQWPPRADAEAPGAERYAVVQGALPELID